jgi:hypothetical protein
MCLIVCEGVVNGSSNAPSGVLWKCTLKVCFGGVVGRCGWEVRFEGTVWRCNSKVHFKSTYNNPYCPYFLFGKESRLGRPNFHQVLYLPSRCRTFYFNSEDNFPSLLLCNLQEILNYKRMFDLVPGKEDIGIEK